MAFAKVQGKRIHALAIVNDELFSCGQDGTVAAWNVGGGTASPGFGQLKGTPVDVSGGDMHVPGAIAAIHGTRRLIVATFGEKPREGVQPIRPPARSRVCSVVSAAEGGAWQVATDERDSAARITAVAAAPSIGQHYVYAVNSQASNHYSVQLFDAAGTSPHPIVVMEDHASNVIRVALSEHRWVLQDYRCMYFCERRSQRQRQQKNLAPNNHVLFLFSPSTARAAAAACSSRVAPSASPRVSCCARASSCRRPLAPCIPPSILTHPSIPCSDGVVKLWDPRSGALPLRTFTSTKGKPISTVQLYDNLVMTSSLDNTVVLYDVRVMKKRWVQDVGEPVVRALLHSSQRSIVVSLKSGLAVLDIERNALLKSVTNGVKHKMFMDLAWGGDNETLFAAGVGGAVHVFGMRNVAVN